MSYSPDSCRVSADELRRRHEFSVDKSIIPIGCENTQQSIVLEKLVKNFTIPSLFIRNFPDYLILDDSKSEPPFFVEVKTDLCKTVEFTQLYQNKQYCKMGIPVYYSLGSGYLIEARKISHNHIFVSPNSKEYFDRDWKLKLEKEGCIFYYRTENEVKGSHDPFVYIDYSFFDYYCKGQGSVD